ncbi:unnamed protein product [Acanthoscelides obtectus]|uniref:BZIP domain-containing protein n=1 Tax=Acanthoscelides obtectus TaxID=200917 RepID=A0A9P0LVT6_ACAOB|nr:unnamed protein product [Acanthoscelides obtectus]CAK1665374.1 Cyclic AMP-responsive element-binding protein 3-like protein 4 [Acanthoscelides obtectus]
MDTMDVSLNYDESDLMSSEFFDSVLSLENNMEDGFLSALEDDINLSSDTSSHMDEVLSPQSFYSESDKNSLSSTDYVDLDDSANVHNIDNFDDPLLMSLLESLPETKPEVISVPAPVEKQPTKILIQNPNNKKFIAKPIVDTTQLKTGPLKVKPQILKVQPILNNGRPVLLPLSLKSIKILNASPVNLTALSNIRKRKIKVVSSGSESEVTSSTNQYPPLILTHEEKKLLEKEGIQLPTHHPLTKNEERELKRIRRKIRNKISAQDSRKRKKEYVDNLEDRVKRGSEENKNLLQRVRALQRQNKTLIAHVNKLQAMIKNSTTTKATPSTCLMVVLLSALLVSLPNMKLFNDKNSLSTEQEQVAVRRSLLSSPQATEDDAVNMEEFLIFKDEDDYNRAKLAEELDIENSTDKEFTKMIEEMEKKYGGLLSENNSSNVGLFGKVVEAVRGFLERDKPEMFVNSDYGGLNKKGFIEPEIDEYLPNEDLPFKRMKYITEDVNESLHSNDRLVSATVDTNTLGMNTKDQ